MYGFCQLLNKYIYIFTPPVVFVGNAIVVTSKFTVVVNAKSCYRVWIEVVVYMQAIDVIPFHYVIHDFANIVLGSRIAWIEQIQTIVFEAQIRSSIINMIWSQPCSGFSLSTIRVNPRMQFHASFMAFINHPLQRIPIRTRRRPLLSC